ncbi:recombination mediator RecR [Xanthomonas sacchari]|uniref:Recombination protein RecR n=1 Tax=Xanthomonas sacchari TaxID=56458 RepID=A0A2P5Z3F7_9XANT|nr:recombination mediator RecR [Xanthomonas sacchari]MCC4591276.1 recombination mediator RecR [Xanthomonas campestris pv. cannae]MDV0439983.1 recombination mediator RecR [Xanthomonas sacchari]PPU82273.1 recombination protein RecR [Xanthomonas sacchari]
MSSPLLEQLIDAFRVLPGVGQKTAQRMAYHVLEREREGGQRLAERLHEAIERIGHCAQCRDFSETEICAICASPARDRQQLCAVESPADRLAIEHATGYRGLYFILQGRLSPLDGIGPRELGLDRLGARLAQGEVAELIIATNSTVEGEATAHYLAQLARQHGVRPSRLAQGLPLGGELEYVDRGTLSHAFGSRSEVPRAGAGE